MPTQEVEAQLQVEDAGVYRALRVTDLDDEPLLAKLEAVRLLVDTVEALLTQIRDAQPASPETGLATQATLAAVLAAIDALELDTTGLATQATLSAAKLVLDALNAKDYATQTTLVALLAELGAKLEPGDLAALSTAAKQDTAQTSLTAIAARLTASGFSATDFLANIQITTQGTQDRLPGALDAESGGLEVRDVFTALSTPASQAGNDTVRTFDLGDPVDLVWVRVVGEIGFAGVGSDPADGSGVYCADDEPTPLTVRTDEVRVWAPTGSTIFVWGYGA